MKWYWVILLAGISIYLLVLGPGILPHEIDGVATILAGVNIASVALVGFDTTHVDRRLATLIIIARLILIATGIALAVQGHPYVQLELS